MIGPPPAVVILYRHPLLGEGIGRIVLAETGAPVTVVPAGDRAAVAAALALAPAVIIVEGPQALSERDLAELDPGAVLIDVGAAMSTGTARPAPGASLECILSAIRNRVARR